MHGPCHGAAAASGFMVSRRAVVGGGVVLAASMGNAIAEAGGTTDVVEVFDTFATRAAENRPWRAPVHVWVYQPEDSHVRKAFIARLLANRYGLIVDDRSRPFFDRRINLLLSDNQRGRRIGLTAAGVTATLPATGGNGHARGVLTLPAGTSQETVEVTGPKWSRRAAIRLIEPDGVSIICDIDDTVKVTGVTDRRSLWSSTFFEPFKAVAGMRELLGRIGGGPVPVHYVSSSPWHLHAPLREWMQAEELPLTSFHLKHIRLKDRSILDILAGPETTKPPQIEGLLSNFPKRRFILVGDSGERDPEIYAAAFRSAPQRINRILIRKAPGGENGATRFETAFNSVPRSIWTVFDDPSEVRA